MERLLQALGPTARRCLRALPALIAGLLLAWPAAALYPPRKAPEMPAKGGPSDLSGIWRIDWSQSDPRPRMDGTAIVSRVPRERSAGPRTAEGTSRKRPLASEDAVPSWARARLTAQTLIIFQEGRRVELSVDGHRLRKVEAEAAGRDTTAWGNPGDRLQGRWEQSHLVVTSVPEDGATMTETFALRPGGRLMDVVTRILTRPNGPAIVMNRVYRKYAGV